MAYDILLKLRKHFRAVEIKFCTQSKLMCFVVSCVLFDFDYRFLALPCKSCFKLIKSARY